MKKLLIATSAVVGLGMGSVNFAAAQLETSMSGLVRVRLQDKGTNTSAATLEMNRVQLTWRAAATSDSGLTYGAQIRIRDGESHEDNIYIGGSFGSIIFGEHGGAADLNNGIEAVGAGTGGIDGAALFDTGINEGITTHDIDVIETDKYGDGDGTKVTYISPSFGGLTVAASYQFDGDGDENVKGDIDQSYDVGLAYNGSFGDTSIGAHLAYGDSKYTEHKVNVEGATFIASRTGALTVVDGSFTGKSSKNKEWMAGFNAGFGPVTAGMTYRDNKDKESSTMAAGVKYGFGAGNVSLNYAKSEVGYNDSNLTSIVVSADYTVAPGWVVQADVSRNRGEVGAASENSTSWVLGTNLSF